MTLSSAQTVPAFPGAASLSDADLWEHYRALGLSPDEAQKHVLRRRNARQAVADNPLPPIPTTSPEAAALLGASRTATSGFGDELAGALDALRGPPPQNLQQRLFGVLGGKDPGVAFDPTRYAGMRDVVREAQAQALAEHPVMTLASGAVGAYANPLNYVLGPATRFMGPIKQGATVGATLGAAQGAGEGTDALSRATGALRDAVAGAATGAALGGPLGLAGKLWARIFGKAPPVKVSEAQVRAQLTKLGFKAEDIEQAVNIWRGGGLLPGTPKRLPAPPAPPPPPTVRPGETINPIPGQPRGLEVRGTRATPPVPTAPTILEMQTGQSSRVLPDIGGGKTLPYYPRGGLVEQSFGAPPATSPAVPGPVSAQGQLPIFADYLKGATPADLGTRLGTLRDLGVALPQDAEAQLLALLFGAH